MADDFAVIEYEALRATIRERGTWRIGLGWFSLVGWAALLTVGVARGLPLVLLASLLSLAAGFEAVYALHVGVERIGRYLQVMYEQSVRLPAWERTAMAYGRERPRDGVDPIFSKLFATAALVNLIPMLFSGQPGLVLAGIAAHAIFVLRLFQARQYARRQRAEDLEKFQRLKAVSNEQRATGNE